MKFSIRTSQKQTTKAIRAGLKAAGVKRRHLKVRKSGRGPTLYFVFVSADLGRHEPQELEDVLRGIMPNLLLIDYRQDGLRESYQFEFYRPLTMEEEEAATKKRRRTKVNAMMKE